MNISFLLSMIQSIFGFTTQAETLQFMNQSGYGIEDVQTNKVDIYDQYVAQGGTIDENGTPVFDNAESTAGGGLFTEGSQGGGGTSGGN